MANESGTYDSPKFQGRHLMPLGAVSAGTSVPGTAAAATTLLQLRLPGEGITIDEAAIALMTGGTAAGPSLLLQKQLAGTGSGTTFASYLFNTAADATNAVMTVTSTSFATNDVLLVVNAAGTAASTPKIILTLGYRNTFGATNPS